MADIEQLKRALKNADAAGDVEAAKKLAAAIRTQMSDPKSQLKTTTQGPGIVDGKKTDSYYETGIYAGKYNPLGPVANVIESGADQVGMMLDSAGRGIANAATMGFADEFAGSADAVVGRADSVGEGINNQRAIDQQRAKEYPGSTLAGELVGALALPAAGMKAGVGLTQNAARAGTAGAINGGLSGIGNTEDKTNLGDLAHNVGMGAALGGSLGAGGSLASLAGRGVAKAGDMYGDVVNDIAQNISPVMSRTAEPINEAITRGLDKLPFGSQTAKNVYDGLGGSAGIGVRSGAVASGYGGTPVAAEMAARLGGRMVDKVGQQMSKPAVSSVVGNQAGENISKDPGAEALRNPKSVLERTTGTKYEYPLLEAAGRGRDSLIAQVHILSQSDPEFRKLFEQ